MLTWWLIGKEPTLHKSSPINPIKDMPHVHEDIIVTN